MSPFTLPLSIALLGGLTATFLISRVNLNTPPVLLYFIIPLLVIYVLFQLLNSMIPNIQTIGNRMGDYTTSQVFSGIDETSYFQIFPTLFAVFLLFMVLLAAGMFRINTITNIK